MQWEGEGRAVLADRQRNFVYRAMPSPYPLPKGRGQGFREMASFRPYSNHTFEKRGIRKGLKPFTFERTACTLVREPKGSA